MHCGRSVGRESVLAGWLGCRSLAWRCAARFLPSLVGIQLVTVSVVLVGDAVVAQNFDQPGKVWLGEEWGTFEEAARRDFFEYRGRWLPAAMRRNVGRWESADRRSASWSKAHKAKARYYRVRAGIPRHDLELDVLPFLDCLYETYTRIFREDFGLSGKAANKKAIYVYGGYAQYREQTGRPRTNPGYIVNSSDLHCLYEPLDPGPFYKTVFHEGAHQFFGSLMPGASLPQWLTEALATYFEGCTWSRARQEITFDSVPADRLRFAKLQLARVEQPDPEIMFMNVAKPQYTALHYALGWSFLHFLLHTQEGRFGRRFGELLDRLNGSGSKPFAEVFRGVYGEDFLNLARGWRDYVMALPEPAQRYFIILNVPDAIPGVDVRTGDLLCRLDGLEVWDANQFHQVRGQAQQGEDVVTLEAIRKVPMPDVPGEYTLQQVRVVLQPAQVALVNTSGHVGRGSALRD